MLTWLRNRLAGIPAKPAEGRSPHWPSVRAAHLRIHPTCAACGGTVSLEVHHIRPFHERPDLELDDANLLTLCEKPDRHCHLTFGHFFEWRRINPAAVLDSAWWLRKMKAAGA